VSRRLTPGRSVYRDFCERLDALRVRDRLENVGVRDMDRFLWLWGLWLAQHGREKRVINQDVYDAFVSKDPDVRLLVHSSMETMAPRRPAAVAIAQRDECS
jgi:hypothetical protein